MKWGLALICAAALWGCGNSSTTNANSNQANPGLNVNSSSVQPVSNPNAAVLGNWKGRIEMPKTDKNDPAAQMAEAFVGMLASSITLEFKDADVFELSMMGMPISGIFEIDGSDITLTPTTFMGVSKEQFQKEMAGASPEKLKEMEKPMEGTISKDGKTIRLQGSKPSDGTLVFERAAPLEPKVVAKETVRGVEKGLVGVYQGDLSSLDVTKLSESEKKSLPMMKSVLGNSVIVLSADNTYVMNLVMDIEGTWLATGGKLTLTPTKLLGVTPANGMRTESEIMEFWVKEDGKSLEMMPRTSGQPSFSFKRKE